MSMTTRAGALVQAVPGLRRSPVRARLVSGLAWVAVAISLFYALYAAAVGLRTAATLVGLADPAAGRSVPPLFALHTLTGAACLAAGALQLRSTSRTIAKNPRVHKVLGRVYLIASWATSLVGVVVAAGFDVGASAILAFTLEAVLWLVASALAYRYARRHRYAQHGRWMIRSYALALFFITFSVVHPTVAALLLDRTAGYTIAIVASVSINLAGAEWLVRRRLHKGVSQGLGNTTTAA